MSLLRFTALGLLLMTASTAFAVNPDEVLSDPVLEARARAIGQGLRCLVCQNESIDESNAPLAHDLRVLVRERLTHGDTDDQVRAFVRARYGDFVLLDPPVEQATLALWFGPPLLVIVAASAIYLVARRPSPPGPRPLDAGEQARLARLIDPPGPPP